MSIFSNGDEKQDATEGEPVSVTEQREAHTSITTTTMKKGNFIDRSKSSDNEATSEEETQEETAEENEEKSE